MDPILQDSCGLVPGLSAKSQHTFIFDELKIGSLVSIGQLYDDEYITLLTKYVVKMIWNNKVIITVERNNSGLWNIPL